MYRPKLIYREFSTVCGTELIQTLIDSDLGDLDDVHNLANGAAEIVHSSGQDQGRTTDTGRASSGGHPVTIHPLNYPTGFFRDLHGSTAEFELSRESIDEILRINGVHEKDGSSKAQLFQQQLVSAAEFEYVNLFKELVTAELLDLLSVDIPSVRQPGQ
jgi:hypothetical protein